MFKDEFPEFKQGNILKQKMLENLRDYPRDFLRFYFNDYSNGIINGVRLLIDKQEIKITEGLIKFNGRIYSLKQAVNLEYSSTNEENIIKINFSNSKEQADFKIYESKVSIDSNLNLGENELELGRFKLRQGAQLRAEYDKFQDFKTEYNTINLIQVKYSARGQATLHPLLINKFAQNLLQRSNEMLDNLFAMESINSRAVSRSLIINYLAKRLDIAIKNYDNLELYSFLEEVINNLSRRKKFNKEQSVKQNKIIVD